MLPPTCIVEVELPLIFPLAVMCPENEALPRTSNVSDGSFVPKPNLVGLSM